MFELTAENAADYLRDKGFLAPQTAARAEVLAWGVSNQVLRVCPEGEADFVVKQSRKRLRTRADWFSRLERIYREVEVMRAIGTLLPPGVVPAVLFEVREDYLFGMEAVPARHVVWKAELLAGRFDRDVAGLLGEYLATVHRETAGDSRHARQWSDREVFDELRVDPFYRRIAAVHPEIGPAIDRLIDETLGEGICAVLGDFSPKNVLIVNGRISLVDFETGHYGDPAFDLGFFLSHILLKAVLHATRGKEVVLLARAFWTRYCRGLSDHGPSGPNFERRPRAANNFSTSLPACWRGSTEKVRSTIFRKKSSRTSFASSPVNVC